MCTFIYPTHQLQQEVRRVEMTFGLKKSNVVLFFCFFVFYPFRGIWECTIAFPTSPCVFCGLWECVWPHLLLHSVMLFQEFGVSGLLLQATKSLYNRSKTLVCTVNYNSDLLSIWSVKKEMMDGWWMDGRTLEFVHLSVLVWSIIGNILA